MALLAEWRQYAESKQQEQGAKFWQDYFKLETEFYKRILESKPRRSTVQNYAKKYGVDLMTMMGFLDGINDSLKEQNDLESLEAESEVNLNYDKELLYKNMVEAKADWLYGLPQWDKHLTAERRAELYKEQKRSKTVVKGEKNRPQRPLPLRQRQKI